MKVLNILTLTVFVLSIIACSSENKGNENTDEEQVEKDLTDYFFPSDSLEPYIYVYAEESNPMDEKIYRVYKLSTPEKEHLVVERYNSNFRITEGYTHDLKDRLNVVDHMIVDARGKKRKAQLTEKVWFPADEDESSVFISDFPAHLDSLLGVYKSEKEVLEKMEYKILQNETDAIIINDEVTLSFVNPNTQKGSSNSVEMQRVYAKGFGLTEWFTKDKRVHYKLKRILSNEWWKEHAQGPAVKGVVE